MIQDKDVSVIRLKDGESPPMPDPNAAALGGGVSLSATGRPQRKTRGKKAMPFGICCSSDETVAFFKLKVSQIFRHFAGFLYVMQDDRLKLLSDRNRAWAESVRS